MATKMFKNYNFDFLLFDNFYYQIMSFAESIIDAYIHSQKFQMHLDNLATAQVSQDTLVLPEEIISNYEKVKKMYIQILQNKLREKYPLCKLLVSDQGSLIIEKMSDDNLRNEAGQWSSRFVLNGFPLLKQRITDEVDMGEVFMEFDIPNYLAFNPFVATTIYRTIKNLLDFDKVNVTMVNTTKIKVHIRWAY
jgi:hypothetical protein